MTMLGKKRQSKGNSHWGSTPAGLHIVRRPKHMFEIIATQGMRGYIRVIRGR